MCVLVAAVKECTSTHWLALCCREGLLGGGSQEIQVRGIV